MGGFLPITTDRLVLRTMAPVDAVVFARYRSDPDVARYQSWDAPYSVAFARALIDHQSTMTGPVPGDWIQIAVTLDGELVGDVAVGLGREGGVARIGYTLDPGHHGKGLAREAVGAVVERLFEVLDVHRVDASLDPRNIPSARLVEQLGFEFEGTASASELVGGEWTDDARYALLRDRWDAWRHRPVGPPQVVRLVAITPDLVRPVLDLAVHRSQERFVAPVSQSLAEALHPPAVDGAPEVPWLRAVEADGALAGFVMLADVTTTRLEPMLWRFLIDRRHQRRGVGRRAIELLVARCRSEGHDTLLTSWIPGPGGPEPFYRGLGFVPTGEVDDGEIVARLRC